MIGHLRGTVYKGRYGVVILDVQGVGYRLTVPGDTWEFLKEQEECFLSVSTYLREDRLELFGFFEEHTKTLFEKLLEQPGIGPKISLELCALPRALLLQATTADDVHILSQVKGIGKKKAEKLLLELRELLEKCPELFTTSSEHSTTSSNPQTLYSPLDPDALAALTTLGYSSTLAARALQKLPKDLHTTGERIAAALRSL